MDSMPPWLAILAFAVLIGTAAWAITEQQTMKQTPQTVQSVPAALQAWQTDYSRKLPASAAKWTQNTNYYDLDDIRIKEIAGQIAAQSTSATDAMHKAAEYVYDNIEYDAKEGNLACEFGTATKVLERRTGQCDTQGMLLIALYRSMGIASRSAAGCVFQTNNCWLQAVVPGLPGVPKYVPLQSIGEGQEVFGRAGGGLHTWVQALDPEQGWINVEATTGKFINTKCWNYHSELYPDDADKTQMCITTNRRYAQACLAEDLAALNANGIVGLVTEVTPWQ